MTITSIQNRLQAGASGNEALFHHLIKFLGAANYNDGGVNETALLQAAVGKDVTPIAIIPVQTVGSYPDYEPRLVPTQASVVSAATFATADQDTNTIIYKLNGAAAATLTLSGAHTTAAHLAASIEAVVGLHAYVDAAGQVTVKTTENGADASIEITGGTANAVYLFPTTENVGSDTLLMLIVKADGTDVGLASASAVDLSTETFTCVLISK